VWLWLWQERDLEKRGNLGLYMLQRHFLFLWGVSRLYIKEEKYRKNLFTTTITTTHSNKNSTFSLDFNEKERHCVSLSSKRKKKRKKVKSRTLFSRFCQKSTFCLYWLGQVEIIIFDDLKRVNGNTYKNV
jgi:hypothetical protein